MKIFHINSYSYGSTGNVAGSIHNALLEAGHQSIFAFGFGESRSENEYVIGSALDFKLHTIKTLVTGLHCYGSKGKTKTLIKKIKEFDPDVVHIHNVHGGYINLKLLFDYLKDSRAHVIVTLHDCWLFTGKCYHYYEANCYKWKDRCRDCPQLSMYPKSLWFDRTSKMFDDKQKILCGNSKMQITAVSNWLANEAKQSFLKEYNISVVHNGIDENVFYPRTENECNLIDEKYGLKGKNVILGVSFSWNPHRGLNDFIELSKRLSSEDRIVLVGLDRSQLDVLPDNIVAIPRTMDKNELAIIYSRANVFVNCSTEETFGLVTAEAMACGTPVVVYNATACAEIVDDVVGAVIEPHSIDDLVRSVRNLQEKKEHISKRCVEKIVQNYTKELMLSKYINIYNELEINH